MPASGSAIALFFLAGVAGTPERVSFPTRDGGLIYADMYGKGTRGVVLAHGGYLRQNGAKTVSVGGGSMGGGAAADASVEAEPGEIDRLVLLGSTAGREPEKVKGRKLFILSRDDLGPGDEPRLPRIRAQYEKATDPKELVVLDGSAHAQFIFDTAQGERLMREILRFLSAP